MRKAVKLKGRLRVRAPVLLQVHYLMILSANWAYLKSAVSTHDYQDIKTKDDQDLEAEARSKEGQNSSYS